MNPIDDPIPLRTDKSLEAFINHGDGFRIFTHGTKTRFMALCVLIFYLVVFFFFVSFINNRLARLHDQPELMMLADNPMLTIVLFYTVAGLGLLLSIGILVFFMWTVIDIWGLQVWTNSLELRVQNTIMGGYFSKWLGTGAILMDDIVELRGTKQATFVYGDNRRLKFTPVEQVDRLVADIMKHAKKAKIAE